MRELAVFILALVRVPAWLVVDNRWLFRGDGTWVCPMTIDVVARISVPARGRKVVFVFEVGWEDARHGFSAWRFGVVWI